MSGKSEQKNDVKTEYCLPLGSDYLNRQSATFFISSNYQPITERTRKTTKRNAITMLKEGRISVEEILTFFPELTSDDVEEIEAEIMQLA